MISSNEFLSLSKILTLKLEDWSGTTNLAISKTCLIGQVNSDLELQQVIELQDIATCEIC